VATERQGHVKIRRKIAYILAAACLVGDAMIITL
jgi:hypothetical protein